MDISFYMDMSPITVQPKSTVLRLYSIFRGLGLRHLIVVDTEFCVAGIVTRNELTEHAFDDAGEKIDRMYEMQKKMSNGHGACAYLFAASKTRPNPRASLRVSSPVATLCHTRPLLAEFWPLFVCAEAST